MNERPKTDPIPSFVPVNITDLVPKLDEGNTMDMEAIDKYIYAHQDDLRRLARSPLLPLDPQRDGESPDFLTAIRYLQSNGDDMWVNCWKKYDNVY
ncbi:MAG TPA: hypothetical protein PK957_02875, partial [Candidatus Dojkabacteria bacterium]|nr:hypothetical protein [Candidatus Dojkabacteria bacterium]